MADRVWVGGTSTDFTTASNWSPATVPVAGDRIIFDYRAVNNLATGLGQSAVGTITLVIESSFTKYIGDGTNYFQIGATSATIGANTGDEDGSGSSRIMLDFGATANVTTVYRTADAPDAAEPFLHPVRLKGSNISLSVSGASKVGVAQLTGETATLTVLRVTAGADEASPDVQLGRGVTVTSQTINAGNVHSLSDNTAATTIIDGGSYLYEGTGAHTTLTVQSDSTCVYSGTGSIGTGEISGSFDASRDGRSKSFGTTAFRARRGASLLLDNGVNTSLTFPNGIEYPDGIGALDAFETAPSVKGTLVNI